MPMPLIRERAPRFVRLSGADSIGSASAHPRKGVHMVWRLLGALGRGTLVFRGSLGTTRMTVLDGQ